ncbi:oligosaccharide repeat unit polymerase [Vibrio parahaemolyticus]|nr:oligosaccharide repeat unit polymerase [Vibrio parahaemolyticus]
MNNHSGIVALFSFWFISLLGNLYEIADIIRASYYTYAIFSLFMLSFFVGYLFIEFSTKKKSETSSLLSFEFKWLYRVAFFILLYVLICLYISGGLTMTPYEYFLSQRGSGVIHKTGTGVRALELIMQLLVQPAIISLISLLCFSIIKSKTLSKRYFVLVVLNAILYSYFYQANTTVVFLCFSLILTFSVLLFVPNKALRKRKKVIFLSSIIMVINVFIIAANRYGSLDFFAILLYYPGTYFTISLSIFDYYLQNSSSILHSHTFGESIVGYISLFLSLLLRSFGDEFTYTSASVENVTNNAEFINLGSVSEKYVNAFGSILFSSFRDFGAFGVALVGLTLGIFLCLSKSKFSDPFYGAVHMYLLGVLILAFTVSPFDAPYFWQTILLIYLFSRFLFFKKLKDETV